MFYYYQQLQFLPKMKIFEKLNFKNFILNKKIYNYNNKTYFYKTKKKFLLLNTTLKTKKNIKTYLQKLHIIKHLKI
jgi:hypothetical protein